MGEHTPGPWKVVGTEIWGANVKIASGRGAYDEKDRQKNKANARLIAAAPDLLEALRKILHWYDTDNGSLANMANTVEIWENMRTVCKEVEEPLPKFKDIIGLYAEEDL